MLLFTFALTALAADPTPTDAKGLTRTPEAVWSAAPGRWALLIGVDEYADANISDLQYTANDARALAAALIESGAWPAQQVILMTPDQSDPSLQPTRANILEQLQRLESVEDADMVMFFFSGHGSAAGPEERRKNYLYPSDARASVPEQTGLALDDVMTRLGAVDSQQRVVILDACRNELYEGAKAVAPAFYDPAYTESKGTRIVFSTEFGQYSYENPEAQLGMMTTHLVDALRGEADGAQGTTDGVVGLNEAIRHTQRRLRENPGPQGAQVLYSAGEWSGEDFALVPTPVARAARIDRGAPICPSGEGLVADEAQQAIARYNSGDHAGFFDAYARLRESVDCAVEPLSAATVTEVLRVQALWSERVKDLPGAVGAMVSLRAVAPDRPPWEGVSATARTKGLDLVVSKAEEAPAPPSHRPELPAGVSLWVNGQRSDWLPDDVPAVVQAVNWDGSVQWTTLLRPGEPLPELLPAPLRDVRQGLTLGFGAAAGASALTSAGLGLGAWGAQRDAEALAEMAAKTGEVSQAEVEAALLRAASLRQAATLGLGVTVTFGAGSGGAWVLVPTVEERERR